MKEDDQFASIHDREHCLAVKELYCHKEWLVLEGSTSIQPGFLSSVTGSHAPSSLLPNCQVLPSLGTDPDACTHVPFVGKKSLTQTVWFCPAKSVEHCNQNTLADLFRHTSERCLGQIKPGLLHCRSLKLMRSLR